MPGGWHQSDLGGRLPEQRRMIGGYQYHPFSTEEFRARSDSKPMGITNHGWQCQWCLKRTAVVAGRKKNPYGAGFICVACSKKGEK